MYYFEKQNLINKLLIFTERLIDSPFFVSRILQEMIDRRKKSIWKEQMRWYISELLKSTLEDHLSGMMMRWIQSGWAFIFYVPSAIIHRNVSSNLNHVDCKEKQAAYCLHYAKAAVETLIFWPSPLKHCLFPWQKRLTGLKLSSIFLNYLSFRPSFYSHKVRWFKKWDEF